MKKFIGIAILVLELVLGTVFMPCQEAEAATYLTTTSSGDWYMDETSAVATKDDSEGHAFAVNIYCGNFLETVYYNVPVSEKTGYFYYKSDNTHQQWVRVWIRSDWPVTKAFIKGWDLVFGYPYS